MKGGILMETYLDLTVEEKKQVVRGQLKNLQYGKYQNELAIELENSSGEPNLTLIDSYNNDLLKINNKENFLLEKLNELELLEPTI